MASLTPNVCQYWSIDADGLPSEPGTCPHWDPIAKFCSYVGNGGAKADFYPLCNFLGTAAFCAQYAGTGLQSICILPDPSRHVINRRTGKKWVPLPELGTDGLPVEVSDFSAITGYNNGNCDGAGTQVTCSGYSPYHLQFGILQPDKEGDLDVTALDAITEYRLPLSYEIYNRRAELSPCYFWDTSPSDFTVSNGLVIKPIFGCIQSDEIVLKYNRFSLDKVNGIIVPPCNGAKAECPHYTGVCWRYCKDEKMRQGDKVLAEQILELRWHIRKELWDSLEYYKIFKDPELFAWAGTVGVAFETNAYQSKPLIPAIRTYISDFETMTLKHVKLVLTEGINADDYAKSYPTLVEELKLLPLSPIIRNKFDKIDVETNLFETGDFSHKYILLVGDTFTSNTDVFALNLSDPELSFLSSKLQQFDSMYRIKMSMGNQFDAFYDELCATLDDIKIMMPDKVFRSDLPNFGYMFYIPVETFWGYNKIIVMADTENGWEYDSIEIFKPFVGGVVAQTSFTIEGDGGEVSYLPAYENDFGAYNNNNGSITFKFLPMVSYPSIQPEVAYAYIDGVRERLPANPALLDDPSTYEFTYKLYRELIEEDLSVDYYNMSFFGNAGYGFIFITDTMKRLSNIIKPWKIEGSIFLVYGDGSLCEMEVYEQGTDRLPINCFIVRPKDINDFKSVCPDTFLTIPKIYIYERRTFESSLGLEAEIVKEDFVEDDAVVQYRTNLSLTSLNNVFTIRGFGYESLMASVVYKGPSGRIIGQTKTKLITFVRQPYCRDVEIDYKWKAAYFKSKLLPEFDCWGKIGVVTSPNLEWVGYTPKCGDHDMLFFTGRGPMWYPYTDCDEVDYYRLNNINEFDIGAMEIFTENQFDENGVPIVHGSHDMRMIGPANHFGLTGESHASIWNCTCDWTLYNMDKTGDNIFNGYANYRGGLDEIAKLKALRMNGSLPKFGNVYRDFLRSFRSMDNIDYYYWNGSQYTRRRKWVPMYEFYSPVFSDRLSTYPYRLYSYSDYLDDKSMFIHPFGCYVVSEIEGVAINESFITSDEGTANRYKADEIFRSHYSLAGLYYPTPKNPSQYLVGGNLVDIIPWYTYHDSPMGDDYSIQWAWREYWRELKRGVVEPRRDFKVTYIHGHPVVSILPSDTLLSPYFVGDVTTGRHIFLNISYPEYRYDGFLKEHQLVCDEGLQTITVIPPDTESGELEEPPNPDVWQVKLNDGPPRCFNISTGNWVTISGEVGSGGDPDDKCNIELYDTCTKSPWVEDVTLFDTGYNSITPDPDRTITDYSVNPAENTYYQRGLNVSIIAEALNFLPRKLIDASDVEMKLSLVSTCAGTNENSDWYGTDSNLFFPFSGDLNLEYCPTDGTITATFKFPRAIKLAGLVIIYDYGTSLITSEIVPGSSVTSGTLWYIPGIKIYRSEDDSVYNDIYSYDSMAIASKTDGLQEVMCFYDMHTSLESIKATNYMKMIWRMLPNSTENDRIESIKQSILDKYVYINERIKIKYIHIYDSEFVTAEEQLNTYERLYNISHGTHGDFPPHGYDSTGSLLYVLPNDKSTVYQMDSVTGVVGMPGSSGDCKSMNKVRGRLMKECHQDKESLEGALLDKWEEEQKKIHDAIAINSGNTTITLQSVSPPNMDYLFNKANVRFPSWSCVLRNTIVAPLQEVPHYDTFSPGGHTYIRVFSEARRQTCGRIFVRVQADTFEYAFKRFSDPDNAAQTLDWVVLAYFRGTGRLLITPFLYLQSQFDAQQRIAESIKASATSNSSRYVYPDAAAPLY